MRTFLSCLCFLLLWTQGAYCLDEFSSIPQQIHLSYGRNPLEMVVTWTTYVQSDTALVQYSRFNDKNFSLEFGETTEFIDGGTEARVHYIHRVLITGLQERTLYRYRCGSNAFWSGFYSFRTFTLDPKASSEILIFGDLGLENGQSIPRIRAEVLSDKIDAILHVGDFAYNMDDNNSRIGDEFMRVIEPIAAYIPYQVCVGNHEEAYNFSNYNNRFSMINMWGIDAGQSNNWFYSFYMGPALFIGFSTEFYYFTEYGFEQMATQYRWLEKMLALANKPENRARWPWLITFAHRPMYCSNIDITDCTNFMSVIRGGYGPDKKYGLESLFYKYGVDLEIWAHEHSYERFYPIYDRQVFNGTSGIYHNPRAPVHIITGAGGCRESIDEFVPKPPEWSAVRISDYGYTRMNIINQTHLRIRQISDDRLGEIVDDFTIVKDYHGSYLSADEFYTRKRN